MAWRGPSGLLGEPETDRESYEEFPVQGHRDLSVWVHRDVLAHMGKVKPTAEGDHLFFVDGYGRLRFRLIGEAEE